jgi:hypothetical protein
MGDSGTLRRDAGIGTSRGPQKRIELLMKWNWNQIRTRASNRTRHGMGRHIWLFTLALIPLVACTPERRSPDAIREDTARVTSEATKDAKAVAQGVVDGLKQKGPVNINKASEEDLKSLPGIDAPAARRIVDGRPYDSGSDLVKKHLISREEYNHIADKIVAR